MQKFSNLIKGDVKYKIEENILINSSKEKKSTKNFIRQFPIEKKVNLKLKMT
jgi:hypothetical protein